MTSKIYRLLSQEGRHPKISKNLKVGVLGVILHLAPADGSGFEVCPMRSAGCTAACLNTAGFKYKDKNGNDKKQEARIARTRLYFEDRRRFMAMLEREIHNARTRARKKGYMLSVRLNGTSDIPWENVPILGAKNIMEVFPDVAFMDYTKRPNRRSLPRNYRLVFSRSESNQQACVTAIQNGMNVAVVFDTHKDGQLPTRYQLGGETFPVIDGDEHDFRYHDYDEYPGRVIVGLRAKGQAIHDKSGFVESAQFYAERYAA